MIKILYHGIDDDGKCAAAIARIELMSRYAYPFTEHDFIPYAHTGVIEHGDFEVDEKTLVFIVDLSMDHTIFHFIKHITSNGGKVVHIDHHASGIKFLQENQNELSEEIESGSYVPFMRNGLSGCLLTYIYFLMSEEEQKNPRNVDINFDEKKGDVILHAGGYATRIPTIIRYINDWDIWSKKMPNIEEFHYGFDVYTPNPDSILDFISRSNPKQVDEKPHEYYDRIDSIYHENPEMWEFKVAKHPLSKEWDKLIYTSTDMECHNIISMGGPLYRQMKKIYHNINRNSYEIIWMGKRFRVCNVPIGGSAVFENYIKEYDAVCSYSYTPNGWKLSFYSDNETGIDVSEFIEEVKKKCRTISGGGHAHAGGMTIDPSYTLDEIFS